MHFEKYILKSQILLIPEMENNKGAFLHCNIKINFYPKNMHTKFAVCCFFRKSL